MGEKVVVVVGKHLQRLEPPGAARRFFGVCRWGDCPEPPGATWTFLGVNGPLAIVCCHGFVLVWFCSVVRGRGLATGSDFGQC